MRYGSAVRGRREVLKRSSARVAVSSDEHAEAGIRVGFQLSNRLHTRGSMRPSGHISSNSSAYMIPPLAIGRCCCRAPAGKPHYLHLPFVDDSCNIPRQTTTYIVLHYFRIVASARGTAHTTHRKDKTVARLHFHRACPKQQSALSSSAFPPNFATQSTPSLSRKLIRSV